MPLKPNVCSILGDLKSYTGPAIGNFYTAPRGTESDSFFKRVIKQCNRTIVLLDLTTTQSENWLYKELFD